MKLYKNFEDELNKLKQESCFRNIIPVEKSGDYIFLPDVIARQQSSALQESFTEAISPTFGKKYLNLNSNDYLGIANDKNIRADFLKDANYALGSTSSRLLCGNDSVYKEFEDLLAKLFKKPALIFNSGYHANIGIISGLAKKGDVIFSDKLNHASIIDGMKLSGADFYRYKHLNYEHLKELLIKHRNDYKNAFIISESLFSMDGDSADLKKLVELKEEFGAILIVDEAHAFGVYGENGLGIAEKENLIDKIDVIVATFGKAVGSMGAFCVADEILINYLKNKSRTLIFSTALPEINIAFSKYIIETIFPKLKEKRNHLFETADKFRKLLIKNNFKTIGDSYIIPIIFGENEKAVESSKKVLENEFYILPIRHPTVMKGSARLRVSLTANMEFEQIEPLVKILSK